MALLVSGIEWGGEEASIAQGPLIAERLGVEPDQIASIALLKRSLDARQKRVRWVANFRVELREVAAESRVLSGSVSGVRLWTERDEARHGFDQA